LEESIAPVRYLKTRARCTVPPVAAHVLGR
jgi:hypothetical protein